MRLSQLTLNNYRSYAESQLELHPGPNVLLGLNGVGKTNIAEAVGYLSTLGSHRVTYDQPLVRHGESQAIIRAQAHRGTQEAFLEVEINPGRSNRARINRGNPHSIVCRPFLNAASGCAISATACSGVRALRITTSAGLPTTNP